MRGSGVRGLAGRAAGVLAAALLLAGCEGANLFEGEVAESGPQVELEVDSPVESGEQFSVSVTATAPRGLRFIEVTVVGDPTGSQRFDDYDGTTQVETETFSVTATSASTMTIQAVAQDVNGQNATDSRTIQVNQATTGGPPSN
jgi:hypothetical protein